MTIRTYSLLLLLVVWAVGCQTQRNGADFQSSLDSCGINEAMSSEEPSVWHAVILDLPDREYRLAIGYVDVDSDVVGIGIEETHRGVNADKETVLREEYPVLYGTRAPGSWILGVPVQLRDRNQTKDENAWNEYTEQYREREEAWAECADEYNGNWGWWEKEMPPVWVSLPDPNTVDVNVYLIDRSKHKSKPMKLVLEQISELEEADGAGSGFLEFLDKLGERDKEE